MGGRSKIYGNQSEELAVNFLKNNGYKIVERNYRTRFGEIDIIALDKDTLVFVEVKARRTINFGNPQSSVDLRKQGQIINVALNYLARENISDKPCRFDLVIIQDLDLSGLEIEVIKDAFQVSDSRI